MRGRAGAGERLRLAGLVAGVILVACASRQPVSSLVRIESAGTVGSGFFVTQTLIATSAHVLVGNGRPTLVLGPDGRRTLASVVLLDRTRDVALLRSPVAGSPLLCRASAVRNGERVTAIGFPHGRSAAVASSGTVRGLPTAMIIHDAVLAPGTSGGPLVDGEGRVLGVNAIASRGTGPGSAARDRGLAVKIAAVLDGLAAMGER
jgi:serine protease Do